MPKTIKNLKLIDNWRTEIHRLWSIRLALLSAFIGALGEILPLLTDSVSHGVFTALSFLVAVSAAVARIVKQQ